MKRLLFAILIAMTWVESSSSPALALPVKQPQSIGSDTIVGQTTMTVTVVLTDSAMIIIPITLDMAAQGNPEGVSLATLAITATVPQNSNLIYVAEIQSPIALAPAVSASDKANPPLVVTANRNANLRAGPGTV